MKKVKIFRVNFGGKNDDVRKQKHKENEELLEKFMKDKQIFSFTQSSDYISCVIYTIVYEE